MLSFGDGDDGSEQVCERWMVVRVNLNIGAHGLCQLKCATILMGNHVNEIQRNFQSKF